jgi:hypothetical protein
MANPGGPSRLPRLESWVESGLRAIRGLGEASPERRATVLADIHEGSQPTLVYYALLGISELIAGFALIIDSDATLIGANVVAPLMTPIFGVALAHPRDLGLADARVPTIPLRWWASHCASCSACSRSRSKPRRRCWRRRVPR